MQVMVEFDAEGRYILSRDGLAFAPGAGPLPAPPVLFLGAFGACAGAFAVSYLKTRGLDFAGLRVQVSAEFAENPHRIGHLDVRVTPPAPLADRHLKALAHAVDLCTLKQSFGVTPEITCAIAPPGGAPKTERTEPELTAPGSREPGR